jgi:hypothetical protein
MLRIYRIVKDYILPAILAIVILSIVGEFAIDLAREHGLFENPSDRVGAVLKFITSVRDLAFFWPILLFLVGLTLGMWIDSLVLRHFRGRRSAQQTSALEILYHPENKKFVRREYRKASFEQVTFYSIGIHNTLADRTLYDVVVAPDSNLFVENTILDAWRGLKRQRHEQLTPGSTIYVEFFGLPDNIASDDPSYVFGSIRTFTVRASAKDTKEIAAEFEFNPKELPMIRRLS